MQSPTGRLGRLVAALSLLAFVLPGPAAAQARVEARSPVYDAFVVGGTQAAEGRHPAVALVQDQGSGLECTGSLIAPRWVLTAAHCVPETAGAPLRVALGGVDRAVGFDEVFVTRSYRRHPSYRDAAIAHDVALVKLPEPSGIAPVRLAGGGHVMLSQPGSAATIVGWGLTADGATTPVLLTGDTEILPDRACGVYPGFDGGIMICAGGTAADACLGDSGGPLFSGDGTRAVLLGVVSFGDPDCGAPPTGYARVSAVRGWIDEVVGQAPPSVLRISVDRAATVFGRPLTIRGTLRRAGTRTALVGERVHLLRRPTGRRSWRRVASATTDAGGAVRFRNEPARNVEYRLRHPGSVTAAADDSRVAAVAVRPRVTTVAGRTGPSERDPVRLTGAVAPAHSGRVVLQRRTASGWSRVTTARLDDASRYAILVTPGRTRRYRVVLPAHADHAAGRGPVRTIGTG